MPSEKISSTLVFHHTGVIVRSMADARAEYARLFGEPALSVVYEVASQGVRVCFVHVGPHSCLELVEPVGPDSKVASIARRMATYYHVAYKTPDIEQAVAEMVAADFKLAGDYFASEAFGGQRCIFLMSRQAHLIELIEADTA